MTTSGWLDYAVLLEEAGASALELNIYRVPTDPAEDGAAVEARVLDVFRAVRAAVLLPLAVKLSPFYSALAHLANALDALGADGLILFNRFYQPDIDPEALDVVPALQLSDPAELRLRLRWLAILHGRVRATLAASGGVHTGLDALKAVFARCACGADGVGAATPWPRAAHIGTRFARALARGTRVRLARAGAGQPEPAPLPGPDSLRAGELPAGPAELARRPGVLSTCRAEFARISPGARSTTTSGEFVQAP